MSTPTIRFSRKRTAPPHVPVAQPTTPGSWIIETGGGGGGMVEIPDAPPVTIDPPAEVIFRSDHRVEVDVIWLPSPAATRANFAGVAVYLEDPDISSGEQAPMDGTVPLDGSTSQASGNWSPVFVNDSTKSPAVVFLDSTMGSVPGLTYTRPRDVRIYLAAFGPNSTPHLVRATDPNPTPNIMVNIPLGPGQGNSGQEYAFLITNPRCNVITLYDRPDPQYYITFFYDPPDPATPVPPGMNKFGGVRIIFVYEDSAGNPLFPGTDTGVNIPVDQSENGFNSPAYTPAASGGQFRAYYCSEDDSQPLGLHINSLVEGVTPYCEVIVPPVPSAPDVTNFTISNQRLIWLLDGSFVAQATFSWDLPTGNASVRYAGVFLYLVNSDGATPFPKALTGQQSNVDAGFILDISNIPSPAENWTIAAISVDNNGVLADDPAKYGQPEFHSPTVIWNIGPPAPGTPGSGQEYAPLVTLDPNASATAHETLSADGVGMVTFDVGSWMNPSDNQFGGAQVGMVINHDPTKPTYWSIPTGGTSFSTPAVPSFGNIGADVPVDFYIVSDDPQGHKNSLIPGTTPVIHYIYTPSEGAIIPARSGWFDPSQFAWDESAGGFQAHTFSANIIQVGRTLVVGGAPASFGGSDNGQIAVMDSSGRLLDWLGMQQPGQGNSAPLWGAWLGQVWIGGTNPLDAPIFVDNQGIIEVGGIAAAQGTSYPYISIRDDHGYEKGRIGAKIAQPSGTPGDATGPNPPLALTAGAWFTQLAIGGSNLSNWNVLVIPDPNNPLGSQFQMRNINLFLIDYPAQMGSPANNEYQLKMGNSVWSTGATQGSWQFPGMQIYEVDNVGNQFGAVFLNRGMVLRGTANQGYPVLASLITFNGANTGSDFPPNFWGELAMYSPYAPYFQTVYLGSGSASSGNAYFYLRNVNNILTFGVDQLGDTFIAGILQGSPDPGTGAGRPVTALALNLSGYGPVIDARGNWLGQPIAAASSQTPWGQDINGAGFGLYNAGNIQSVRDIIATQYLVNASGNPVIDSNGAFRGAGVNVGGQGIGCGYLTTLQGAPGNGEVDCGLLHSVNNIVCGRANPATLPPSGWIVGDNLWALDGVNGGSFWLAGVGLVINGFGQFVGPGIEVGNNGIGCAYLAVRGRTDCGPISANGDVHATQFFVNSGGNPVIDQFGAFRGAGVDVGPNQGIGCGYLTTNGGRIDCGSLAVTGEIWFGNMNPISMSALGGIECAGLWIRGVGQVIRGDGSFVLGGIEVGGGGIGCGYLEVRNQAPGNGWIVATSGLNVTNGDVYCRTLHINEWIVSNIDGWALWNASSHNVYCGALFANYWSGSQPVISTDGRFTGSGVEVGGGGIGCSYLTTRGRGGADAIDTGTLNCQWNINTQSNVNAWGGQVYAAAGFTGGPFYGSGVSTGGQIYAGGGFTGGAFYGAGINVGGNGITCAYLTTFGGGPAQVDTNVMNTNNLYIAGQPKVYSDGVWRGSVQCYDNVFGNQFGIMGVAIGWNGSFATGDGRRCYVQGGIVINVA